MDMREGDGTRRGALVAALLATMLLVAGCSDAGIFRRPESAVRGTVLVTQGAPAEAGFRRMQVERLASIPTREDMRLAGGRVVAAAAQVLADLRLGDDVPVIAGNGGASVSGRDLDRLQRHVAAAWHFDLDPAVVDVVWVRLRATIASDGAVRAIEFVDSQGGSEALRARFVEDAIVALDWSSPLPVVDAAAPMRVLEFRFEAGRVMR